MNRRFTHVTGFTCGSQYVEFNVNGKVTIVNKDGESRETDIYTLEEALSYVEQGVWKEIKAGFNRMKFRIVGEEHCKLVQEKLFEMGYAWSSTGKTVQYTYANYLYTGDDGTISYGTSHSTFKEHTEYTEIKATVQTTIAFEEVVVVEYNGKRYNAEAFTKALEGLEEV